MQFLLHPNTSSNSRKMCGNGIPSLFPEESQSIPLIPDSPGTCLCPQLHKIPTFFGKTTWQKQSCRFISCAHTDRSYKSSLHFAFSCQTYPRFSCFSPLPYSELNASIIPDFSFLEQNKLLAPLEHTQSSFKRHQLFHLRTRQLIKDHFPGATVINP